MSEEKERQPPSWEPVEKSITPRTPDHDQASVSPRTPSETGQQKPPPSKDD